MTLIPCDGCHTRPPEKLCQVTWAWYRADQQRTAYRKRLCTACFVARVAVLDKSIDYEALTCPSCGISTEHDMDPVYATCYIPGSGKIQYEYPLCPVCAVDVRAWAHENGEKLEDRQRVEGPDTGPSTPITRESYWSRLGIIPRDATP